MTEMTDEKILDDVRAAYDALEVADNAARELVAKADSRVHETVELARARGLLGPERNVDEIVDGVLFVSMPE